MFMGVCEPDGQPGGVCRLGATPSCDAGQWVLTVPHPLRFLMAQKAEVLTAIHKILVSEIERAYV
jgi:hypothetical protein